MGNIISDDLGNIKTSGNAPGQVSRNTSFAQNMTDLLFELDLLNTGSYSTTNDPNTKGPRPEYDYTIFNPTVNNKDIQGESRKYSGTGASAKLVDMINIPYTDESFVQATYASNSAKTLINAPNDPKKVISNDSNALYNLKRGYCNASNSVPIDIVGVDIPSDDPESLAVKNRTPAEIDKLKNDQKNNYQYKDNMHTLLENCLTWGNSAPPAGQSFFTDAPNGAKIPRTSIPDILNSNGTVLTTDTLNTLASEKNLYGNTLSPECKSILNNTITNSYISPKLTEYSKTRGQTSETVSTKALQTLETPDPVTGLRFKIVDNPANSSGSPFYGTYISTGTRAGQSDMNRKCGELTENICDYYYYYDIKDGIVNNPKIDNILKTSLNSSNARAFANNLRYLNQHIPDCRCKNATNLAIPSLAVRTIPAINGRPANDAASYPSWIINEYHNNGKCESSNDYGQQNNTFTETNDKTGDTPMPIYNINTQNSYQKGYRRQYDPVHTATTLDGGKFLYVPNNARTSPITINNYTCEINSNININNAAGDIIISNLVSTCNIIGANTGSGTGSDTSSSTGSGTSTSPNPVTTVSFGAVQLVPQGTAIELSSPPLNTGSQIKIFMNYPGNSMYQLDFLTKFQFSLALESDRSKKVSFPPILQSNSTCIGNANPPSNIVLKASSCYSPYILNIPFLYGPETNTIGIPHVLVFENNPPTAISTLTAPAFGPRIKLKQYSMRINNISLRNTTSASGGTNTYLLYIGINMNTIDQLPIRVQVVLTPVSGSNAASVPQGCVASTVSGPAPTTPYPVLYQSYSDLSTSLSNGVLVIGNNCATSDGKMEKIQNIKYYYTVILNGFASTGKDINGYTMLYDQVMPISKQCVVDFSNLVSGFNSFTLSYKDYDDDNSEILLLNNDQVKFAATIIISWDYSTIDSNVRSIDLYYDTATSYNANSSSAVKIATANISSAALSGLFLRNKYEFVCPMAIARPIIIYGVVTQATNTKIVSTAISITPTTNTTYFRNWKIVSSSSITDKVPITLVAPNNDINIVNYFNNALVKTNNQPKYTYVMYDSGSSTVPPAWYGGNILSATPPNPPGNITIFQNPSRITPLPTISITSLNNTATLPTLLSLQIGSVLNIRYTINNFPPNFKTDIQVNIKSSTDTSQTPITVSSFSVDGSKSSDSITCSIFYDKVFINPCIYLSSFETFISNSIPIKIVDADNSSQVTMTGNTSVPPNQITLSNVSNPLVKIKSATNQDSVINNMNIKYSGTFPDNKYYLLFDGFTTPLNILQSTITFNRFNFGLPFNLLFGVAGSISSITPFTNVNDEKYKMKKSKELETFYGNLIPEYTIEHATNVIATGNNNVLRLDSLKLDLSQSTLNPTLNIELDFNGYSIVTIQSIELMFGDNRLDNYKFNISFKSDATSPSFQISSILIVGTLTTQISLLQVIPGLTSIKYSSTKMLNNKYALIEPLVYLNGNYKLPETYNSQLNAITNTTAKTLPVKLISAKPKQSFMEKYKLLIIIGVVVIIVIIAVMIYLKWKKSSLDSSGTDVASDVTSDVVSEISSDTATT